MSRTLVIGATGTVGRQVVSQLVAMGEHVRVLVRNPDRAGLPPQVEVMRGDLTAADTLEPCLDDVSSVLLVWVAPPATVGAALLRITKCAKRIVFLSAPLKTPHPLFQQPNPLRALGEEIERLIERAGVEWTFLRPGMFAANAIGWWASQIRAGRVVRWPYLNVPTAPIDERDIAAIAVRTLLEDGHAGKEYVVTGPQALTHLEQLSIIRRVLGRSLRVEEISPDEARSELLSIFSLTALNMLLNAWAAADGLPAYVSTTYRGMTGVPARTFEEWVKDHSEPFRA